VGDYGTIINDTGEFDWEGNIYDTLFQKQFDLADPALRPTEQEGMDDLLIVKSWGVTTKETDQSPEA
jgi:hypothetical protein